MNTGEKQRQRFAEAMKAVSIGAPLRKIGGRHEWRVLTNRRRETSVELTLGHGTKTVAINVPICMSGPCLMDVGMEPARANDGGERR